MVAEPGDGFLLAEFAGGEGEHHPNGVVQWRHLGFNARVDVKAAICGAAFLDLDAPSMINAPGHEQEAE
ncbi:hypothetical protein [Sphingobium bisphenolivorans]|uniref:hypothetical protein n=1 Tax=Sphingobium bisphenolivorans TaxID=1335760 RepID=UPI0003B4448C|nr:hypothetical protein [Sphingobium bisphenolivorans]